MLNALIGSLKGKSVNDATSRRRHSRRTSDRCVTMIGDNMFPVVDWSIGGVQILCDERRFGIGDSAEIALKFQLRDDILDVPNVAHVVRKNKGRVAFEFEPLTKDIRDRFQMVVDDFMTAQFAESQQV